MKNRILIAIIGLFCLLIQPLSVRAEYNLYDLPITPPLPCNKIDPTLSCPVEMADVYTKLSETCAPSYADFLADPIKQHYWVEDDDITAQGKADERARQFLYWVINTSAIDEAPVLRSIWNVSSLIALFGVVLIAAIFGIGYIISQRTQYNFNIRIWPTVIKLGMMLLYIAFSAALVFVLIQLSEVLMKFFYENLGGRDLFNIYFANTGSSTLIGQTEESYKSFVGCRDLNIRVKEGIDAEVFLLKMTNVTYYVMGIMLLLRKILLWFLLFVSPFLALLMPFILIRNTGWIWIGVFFQWLFYGPLLTLFLGGMSRIWKDGIPWSFDFSRVSKLPEGYVYPTGINIVYGGPAQRIYEGINRQIPIGATNNGNYVDTFAEYVITLIMLWAVTFFPWWLLRIFRDYCCEGIYAMKNILLAMYDQMRGTPPTGPSPIKPSTMPSLKLDTPTNMNINTPMSTFDRVKTMQTTDITKNLNLQANKITDIARVETNNQMNKAVNQNLTYLSNPVQAKTPVERQQYMKLRAELFNRAIKNDSVARTMLASTSTSQVERIRIYKEIMKTMPQTVKITVEQITSQETKQTQERVKSVTNNYTKSMINNNSVVNTISKSTNTSNETVKSILQSYSNHTNQPLTSVVKTISKEVNAPESTVRAVLSQSGTIGIQARILDQAGKEQRLTKEQTTKILSSIDSTFTTNKSVSEQITNTTNFSPETVSNVMSNAYSTTTSNEQSLQKISEVTTVPSSQVKTIISSYSSKITSTNESPQTVIQQVATETKNSVQNVQNVMTEAHKTMNTESSIATIANTSHATTLETKSIVEKMNATTTVEKEKSTIQQFTETAQATTNITQQTVQNITESLATNKTVLEQVSNETNISQTDVSNILNSYSQNISTASSNAIAQTISNQTGIKSSDVHNVMQHVASTVSNTPAIAKEISTKVNVEETAIQKVVNAILQTISVETSTPSAISTIIQNTSTNTSEVNSQITQDSVQKIVESLTTNTTFTKQVSETSNVSEKDVVNIMQSYAQNLTTSNSNITNAISQQTGIKTTDVQNVMQHVSSTVSGSPAIAKEISTKVNVEAASVQNVLETIPQTIIETTDNSSPLSKIIQNASTSTETNSQMTQESVQQIIQTLSNNTSFTKVMSETSQVTEEDVINIMQSYAQNLNTSTSDITSSISQQTGISNNIVQNVIKNVASTVNTNTEIVESLARDAGFNQPTVQKVIDVIPQTIEASVSSFPNSTSIANQSSVSTNDVTQIVKSFTSNKELVQQIATNTNQNVTTVETVLNSYANTVNSNDASLSNISQQTGIEQTAVHSIIQNTAETISQSPSIQQQLSQSVSVEVPAVQSVTQTIEKTLQNVSNTPVIENIISQSTPVTEESLQNLFQNISADETIVNNVAKDTNIDSSVIHNLLQTFTQNLHNTSNEIAQNITKSTNLSNEQINQVLQSVAQNTQSTDVVQTLATNSSLSQNTVQNITQSLPDVIKLQPVVNTTDSVIKVISSNSNTTENVSKSAVENILNSVINNTSIMEMLETQTGLKQQQIANIVNTYTLNIDQPAEKIIEKISESSGIQKDSVRSTLKSISSSILSSESVVKDVANTSGMAQEDVSNVIQNQMQIAAAPENYIEKTISIPQSVSLEDYEEVKKMWMNHYEEGEVPVTEKIKNRTEWLEQEIVFITNTLNKLLSTDEKLRQEGLDELGYLLPIFLINNLKGEELIVYLKAKLEAAKSILMILEHENKIKEKMTKEQDVDDEVFVKLEKKKEEDKVMALDEDAEEEEQAPKSIEDRVKAVQEKLSGIEEEKIGNDSVAASLEGIKSKLQQQADKSELN